MSNCLKKEDFKINSKKELSFLTVSTAAAFGKKTVFKEPISDEENVVRSVFFPTVPVGSGPQFKQLSGTTPIELLSMTFNPGGSSIHSGVWKIDVQGSFLQNSPGGLTYYWLDNPASPDFPPSGVASSWGSIFPNTLTTMFETNGAERGLTNISYILTVTDGTEIIVRWACSSDGASTDNVFQSEVVGTGNNDLPNGNVGLAGPTVGQQYRNYLRMFAVKLS